MAGSYLLLTPRELLGRLSPSNPGDGEWWVLNVIGDSVIEFIASRVDASLLYSGRLYFVPQGVDTRTMTLVAKPPEVQHLADELFAWARKWARRAGFLPDCVLDQLPLPSQLGATRTGGIDLNKSRIRAALSAALALTATPYEFTVAQFTAKVCAMTRRNGYTTRQAAYDLPAPRGAPSYPRQSWEELGRRFLGLMAYLASKD